MAAGPWFTQGRHELRAGCFQLSPAAGDASRSSALPGCSGLLRKTRWDTIVSRAEKLRVGRKCAGDFCR